MTNNDWSGRLRGIAGSIPRAASIGTPRPNDPFRGGPPKAPGGGYAVGSPSPFAPPSPGTNPFTGAPVPTPGASGLVPYPPSPNTPAAPVPADASWAAPRATRALPPAVRVAFLSLLIAAAASVVLAAFGVYGVYELRDSVDKVTHLDPTGTATFYTADYVDNAEITLVSSAIALGLLAALGYVLVAVAVRSGRSWPRPVGTALTVLSLPAIFFGPIAVVAVFAGIVGMIALWTPGARQYAAEVKATRRPGGSH